MPRFQADYVIVGGGTAGCVLAARLSEDPAIEVILIEAGGGHNDPRLAVPGGQLFVEDWSKLAWELETQADESLGFRQDVWRRGKGLGGSSSINGLIWNRGLPHDYDAWADDCGAMWGHDAFARALERAEKLVHVEAFRSPHCLSKELLQSAEVLGIPVADDVNTLVGEGLGLTRTNQRNGIRMSAARAYLEPARRRPNLRVLTHSTANRIVFEESHAASVDFDRNGEASSAFARREIILCAGAFHSPKLLLQSGIGPKHDLAELGIDLLVDAPEVGRNLHEHPELYVEYEVDVPTYTSGMSWLGQLQAGLSFAVSRSGPATSPGSHVNGYLKSRPDLVYPDLLVFAGPWGNLASNTPFSGGPDIFSISPALCQPKSRGTVRLKSARPDDAILIDGQLLSNPADIDTLKAGVRLVDSLIQAAPFANHVKRRSAPDFSLDDDAKLENWIRANVGICYHASSTCRMGDDAASVVDPSLKVRGVSGLSICDTSVFPFVPSGNTAAPVIALAELAAEHVFPNQP